MAPSTWFIVALFAASSSAFTLRMFSAILVVVPLSDRTTGSWEDSFSLAAEAVGQMTQDEKLGLLVGVGQFGSTPFAAFPSTATDDGTGRCVGNITPPSRSFTLSSTNLTIPPICLQDGPAGIRLVKNVTGFPTGINAASTFSRRLMRARGVAIAEEFRDKGVQ